MPDREERLAFLLEMVTSVVDGRLRVMDLACGPGSLTARFLANRPDAEVVGVDLDPVLLAIYRVVHAGAPVAVAETDLRSPGWHQALLDDAPFDVVFTATALHWLGADVLPRLYRDLATVLRSGGLFLNADHIPLADAPILLERCGALTARERAALPAGRDDWSGWWSRIAADSVLGSLVAERARRFSNRGDEFTPSEQWHVDALTEAGFVEAAVVWRRGNDAMIAAVR
jgi:SAM-dependent methyltransferase